MRENNDSLNKKLGVIKKQEDDIERLNRDMMYNKQKMRKVEDELEGERRKAQREKSIDIKMKLEELKMIIEERLIN